MSQQPLVSVLIPCWNAEQFIHDAIQSALSQTWPSVEIIVVDDGSTDASVSVIRDIADRRVMLVQQKNAGASAARNHALRVAQGDYIQFLDADDLLSPDKVESQVDELLNCDKRTLGICATMHFKDGESPEAGQLHSGWPMIDSDDPVEWLIELHGGGREPRGAMVHPGAWLVPRVIAEAAGPWDETPSPDDDGEYFARVVLASTGIRCSKHGCSYYRKHATGAGNLSAQRSAKYQAGALKSLEARAVAVLNVKNSESARRAFARCYRQRAFLAYPFAPSVSAECLRRARELGDDASPGDFGTWKGKLLSRLFGWKIVRRLNVLWHRPRLYRKLFGLRPIRSSLTR